jgi:hypothetical protein
VRRAAVLVAALVFLTGCFEEGRSRNDRAEDVPDRCQEPPFDIHLRVEGDGDLDEMEIVDSAAVRVGGGTGYTIYLADFDLPDDDEIAFSALTAPDDGTLVATGVSTFNADKKHPAKKVATGDIAPLVSNASAGRLTAFLTIRREDELQPPGVHQIGQIEVIHVDKTTFCADVSITADDGASMTGIVTGRIVGDQ